jgi:hypothetical protein
MAAQHLSRRSLGKCRKGEKQCNGNDCRTIKLLIFKRTAVNHPVIFADFPSTVKLQPNKFARALSQH